jgi:hypothetical protein
MELESIPNILLAARPPKIEDCSKKRGLKPLWMRNNTRNVGESIECYEINGFLPQEFETCQAKDNRIIELLMKWNCVSSGIALPPSSELI